MLDPVFIPCPLLLLPLALKPHLSPPSPLPCLLSQVRAMLEGGSSLTKPLLTTVLDHVAKFTKG